MTGWRFTNSLEGMWQCIAGPIGLSRFGTVHRRAPAILLCLCAGCASASHVRVEPAEPGPHVSWELHAGGADGDHHFVCGSPQPEHPCILPASTDETRRMATLHLLVYAAAQPTNYLGFMRAPFFGGEAERKVGEVNATVEPGGHSVRTTVIGRVTPTPGTYNLTISVDAQPHGAPDSLPISQEVTVLVK
jgi:hypothetical protein